ncbi:MAG: DUF2203 domain-containing protein [Candidatus Rokubacteria bacterium]|nr:DUF2203 domain-containing protein [Candidatus Rokubacteria bacterium]
MTKYFTPGEVEALIPRLTELMGPLVDLHREVLRLRAGLAEEQRRIMLSGGGILDRDAWRDRSGRVEELTRDIQQGIRAIMALGGVPKDLAMGLVDFPHLMDGREVNLCWRFGEASVGFWHGLDEGFAGRKPL